MKRSLSSLCLLVAVWGCDDDAGPGQGPTASERADASSDAPADDGGSGVGGPGGGGPVSTPACEQRACNAAISDLCCPSTCSAATDIDCAGCGNGRLEAGEICDPRESCAASCPQLGCQTQRLKSGGTCAAVCVAGPVQTQCQSGDECCPPGCTANTDRDCEATCGNGVLETGELCDPLASCPQSCPAAGCTLFALDKAGTCLASCVESGQQSACASDDGCCPMGCTTANDSDCAVQCDNGVVEGKETCDPLASCPQACPAEGCRLRRLVNPGTCNAACVDAGLQTTCVSGDGCCPAGCNRTNDADCAPLCGNSVVEPGETCDPISSCMSQERACVSDAQVVRTRTGEAGACTFVCMEAQRMCGPPDGACPMGCGPTQDPDCPGCGNGVVEPGETCDPMATCQAQSDACVSDATATRMRTGNVAACTFACVETTRTCGAADGSCPPGCTAALDVDCVGCGNGRLDPGETCDPCGPAQAQCTSDANTVRTPTGNAAACTFVCQAMPRPCLSGDGFCPSTCTRANDTDCRLGPGELCEINADCTTDACVDGRCCAAQCATCQACTGAGGTCVNIAKGQEDNVPPRACSGGSLCDGAGTCLPPCRVVAKPSSVDFGTVPIGGQSPPVTVTFSNPCVVGTGSASASVTGAEFMVLSNTCKGALAPGQSCDVVLQFAPRTAGERNGALILTTKDAAITVPLSGTGQASAALIWEPGKVDFGTVPPGERVGRKLSLVNVGNAASGRIALRVEGDASAAFMIEKPGCSELAPHQSCSVGVIFAPRTTGQYAGKLVAAAGNATAGAEMAGAARPRVVGPGPGEVVQ